MVNLPILLFTSLMAMAVGVFGAEVSTESVGGAPDPFSTPTPTVATVTLSVSPTAVSPCQSMLITWTVDDMSLITGPSLTLFYTSDGVLQTGNGVTYNPSSGGNTIAVAPINGGSWVWNTVIITEPGYYVVNATGSSSPQPIIKQSTPFLVTAGDSSCLSVTSAGPTGTTPNPSNEPSQPASSNTSTVEAASSSPPIGSIVGGSVAAIALLGLIIAFLLCRRRRNNMISKNANPRAAPGKGHQRKWGGLASIDKLEGEIPVVMSSNKSPYGTQAYSRTRSRSTGRAMTDEEGMEKGYGKDTFPVDADLLSEMPSLDSKRNSNRYSSDVVNTVLRQSSGLAALNDEHSRNRGFAPAPPVLSTTTAVAGGNEDPFSDAAYMARGNRLSALSVPSTARASSRVSDISGRGAPSPIHSPVTPSPSQPQSQANTMSRNASATASMGRPSRKPVPQYTDDSIELARTSRSSPTSPSRSGSGPAPGSSVADLSSSVTSYDGLTASVDSQTHWLHDHRVPIANRNIGLAGQGDGPVHYLIPDLPPPAR